MVEDRLAFFASNAARTDIHEHQVVVGSAADQPEAVPLHALGQGCRVEDDLLLVRLEGRLQGFMQANGLGGDHVH